MVVNYANKYVEDLGLNRIIRDPEVSKKCPLGGTAGQPTVSFKYSPTIRSKIVNYRQTHEENLNPEDIQCSCGTSDYKDSHHQHVVTGDLSIIEKSELRTLLKKGLNYRDQVPPNKNKALKAVKEGLLSYIKKSSSKNGTPEVMFSDWKDTVLEIVRKKLDQFKPYNFNNVLSKPEVVQELQRLQKLFVFVPTDKAANNVSLVCKKFYVQLLHQEIDSATYNESDELEVDILARHKAFLISQGFKYQEDNQNLPYLYATVKQHKNPVKFRFISPNRGTSLHELSVAVGLCLQRGLKVVKNDSKYRNNFYNRNDYYVIDSHNEVLDFIFDNNNVSGRKSISTFDFNTLYTSIPHHQLRDNLTNFVNRIFEIKGKNFILCNQYLKNAYFSDSLNYNKSYLRFTKQQLLDCIYYLIDNSYVKFNGCVYKQVIGIPMGTSAGPHMANVYLHQYEHAYYIHLCENNMKAELTKMEHIFRFQDDLLALNDGGYLESVISLIYPSEMIVTKTNISVCKSTFLDLSISIYRGKFLVKLFDKRRDYSFDVISFPFLDGNIPKGPSYGVFISQLVRYARVNNSYSSFIVDCKLLVSKLVNQHFDPAALRKRFEVFVDRYFDIWGKFGRFLTLDDVFQP